MKKKLYLLLIPLFFSCVTKKPVEIVLKMEDGKVGKQAVMENAEVLRVRLLNAGFYSPNAEVLDGNSIRLSFKTRADIDMDRLTGYLLSEGKIEFWETFKADEVAPFLFEANEHLKGLIAPQKEEAVQETENEIDSLLADISRDSLQNPIFDLVVAGGFRGSPVIATIALKDTATVNAYLKMPEIKKLRPALLRFARFIWSKPERDAETVDLYALKSNRDNRPRLDGSVIEDAAQTYDAFGIPAVSMQMDEEGAMIWENMTGKAFRERGNIAIVLNDVVYSAPGVSTGPIVGGNSEITGDFTLNQAMDLANLIKSGYLSPMKIVKITAE